MPDIEGTVIRTQPKRGRGPGFVVIKSADNIETELGTFDPSLFKDAAMNVNSRVKVSFEEKPGKKDPTKTYRNLTSLTVIEAPEKAQEAPESTNEAIVISDHTTKAEVLSTRPLGALEEMEEGYKVAQRRHQLVLELLKSRLKEGTHWVDGKMFGADKPVLLQPGAHAIFQALGFVCDCSVISGPLEAPVDGNNQYTIVVRAEVKDLRGRFVGAKLASCSSHIWSSRQGRFVPRAIDMDKTHNSTLLMAEKRATVSACRQTTPASELFVDGVEEGGYGEHNGDERTSSKGGFIRKQ